MSENARALLEEFEKLEPDEQQVVAAEILRRAMGEGEISDEAYGEIGAQVFRMYDEEEGEDAKA